MKLIRQNYEYNVKEIIVLAYMSYIKVLGLINLNVNVLNTC